MWDKATAKMYKSLNVDMKLTLDQKAILKHWFNAYVLMYNVTLKHIKKNYEETGKTEVNFKTLRTYFLKEKRDAIVKKSNNLDYLNCGIKVHMLDGAIKVACANYKSALSNLKAKNIKQFRIKYWNTSKPFYILDVEPVYFTQNSICPRILGSIDCFCDGEPFDLGLIQSHYKTTCKIYYDKYKDKYSLLVPEHVNPKKVKSSKKIISLDPGIRTFMTGVSEDEVLKIGTNATCKIKPMLKKIDKYNQMKLPIKIKTKLTNRYHRKITDLVTDLHWKTIHKITNEYENVLIGDMSVKGIISTQTSNLNKMTKRIAQSLSFYKFRERLEYKCHIKGKQYIKVNEKYTSKMCSNCGYVDDNLGSKKIYNCKNCGVSMDRDVNGCRDIYLKIAC